MVFRLFFVSIWFRTARFTEEVIFRCLFVNDHGTPYAVISAVILPANSSHNLLQSDILEETTY